MQLVPRPDVYRSDTDSSSSTQIDQSFEDTKISISLLPKQMKAILNLLSRDTKEISTQTEEIYDVPNLASE